MLYSTWDLLRPGIKPCLLHWQVDSSPLSHQRTLLKAYHPEGQGERPSTCSVCLLSRVWDASSGQLPGSIMGEGDCHPYSQGHSLKPTSHVLRGPQKTRVCPFKGVFNLRPSASAGTTQSSEETPPATPLPEVLLGDVLSGHLQSLPS